MSRIGKKLIDLPDKVTVELKNQQVIVKGPRGELSQKLHPQVLIEQKEGKIYISVKQPEVKANRALWGLFRILVVNMIKGVTEGYEKKLEIHGVGFKASLDRNNLILNVGFSHPVNFMLPKDIAAKVEKNIITISGIDKQLVGETTARIRNIKKPEPYKGKGIKYLNEIIRRKAGKVVKGAEGALK